MKNTLKKCTAVLLILVLTFALAACGSDEEETTDEGLTPVTVILDWTTNTNHTGMYVAKDLGYYEEAGLDVTIIEPTDGATPTLIAQGKGDFGISYQEDVTVALTSADPLPIKAIAAIIQHNTSGFVSLAGSGIESPKDFEGKTYAGWAGAGESAVIEAVMTENGADFSKLSMVISDGTGFEALGKGTDLMWFFEAWDNVLAERNGVQLDYIPCVDLDERLDYYTPVIIASDEMLEEQPELVKAFLAATAKGYEYCIEDPTGAAEILGTYLPDYDLDFIKESQEILADKYMEDVDQWGVMEDSRWDNYTAFLNEYGVIENIIPASDCYTNEFLPE